MTDWNLEPIFGSYTLIVVLGVVGFAAVILIRSDRQLPWSKRWTLNSLRFLSLLALLIVMLRPGLTLTSRNAPHQSIAVLVDTSASMQLPSGVAKSSRWEVERQVLDNVHVRRESLGKELEWHIFTYDGQLRSLGSDREPAEVNSTSWTSRLPASPQGVVTDVGKPLNEILSTATDPPLMAVVWMGDGAQTTRGDASEAQQSARLLSQLDIPLYLIGIGPRSADEQTRDQILEGIADQSDAFAKNVVPIRGSLRAIGLQNRQLNVRVFLIDGTQKPPQLLNQTTLVPHQLDQSLPFQLSITAPEPGAYQLLVKAEGVDGEATLLNNEQTCFINVRESGSRILYIEGQPRHEQKFIWRALLESPDLQIDRQWMFESSRNRWPEDLSDWLRDDHFDCLIIGDIDAEALGPKTLTRIVELVQSGVGLIMLGGYHAYGSGGYQNSPLAPILPLQLDGPRQAFNQPINERGHWLGELRLEPRGPHPITDLNSSSLESSESNENKQDNAWKELKPLLGANRWRGIREGPGIQVLAVGPENQPLIVSGEAGQGRVLCLAFDSTFRWWLQGKSNYHRQFWRQSVLWTMRREVAEEGLRIEMPRRTLALGESSPYAVTWSPGSKKSPMPNDLELRWSIDGEDRGPLIPQKTVSNWTGQIVQVAKSGRYEISAHATNSEGKPLDAKLPFIVVDMAIEKLQSTPDWQLINQLAKLNESAGGRVVAPEATEEIFKSLAERRRTATIATVRTLRLGDGTIDSWLAFLIVVLLWITQWSLRKAWNLP